MQVFHRYGTRLIKGILRGEFTCFDMTMSIMPAFVLSLLSLVCNALYAAVDPAYSLYALGEAFLCMYITMFVIGLITTVTEWHNSNTATHKKILYTLTFPLFMATYLPISAVSLIYKPKWTPIKHKVKSTIK